MTDDFTSYSFEPSGLPNEILAAIGLIAAEAALAEYVIEQAIGGCLGVDFEYTAAVTTHMANPLRFDVLKAVAEIRIDSLDDLDELDVLLATLNGAQGARNKYLHAGWCRNPKTNQVFTVNTEARGSLALSLVPMKVEAIKRDAAAIGAACMAVFKFFSDRNLLAQEPPIRPRGHKTKAARKKRRETPSKAGKPNLGK